MRRDCAVPLAVLATLFAAPTAGALAHPQIPPALERLLAAGRNLHPKGFRLNQTVALVRDGRRVQQSRLTERGRLSPPAYAITSSVGGQPTFLRFLGSYGYGTAPGIAKADGGHKWVRVRIGHLGGGRASVLALVGAFRADLTTVLLPAATSVTEVGLTTLGGQPVTEFELDDAHPPARVSDVYLAPDGLPVRVVDTVGDTVTTTDASLTAPVVVRVPAARETVDESRLSASMRRRVNLLLAAPPGIQ